MVIKKYPIGTKIRFITESVFHDFFGKSGKIVGIEEAHPLIYLPESKFSHASFFSTKERPVTVQCGWCEIEPLVVKGQQLLFTFMGEQSA